MEGADHAESPVVLRSEELECVVFERLETRLAALSDCGRVGIDADGIISAVAGKPQPSSPAAADVQPRRRRDFRFQIADQRAVHLQSANIARLVRLEPALKLEIKVVRVD